MASRAAAIREYLHQVRETAAIVFWVSFWSQSRTERTDLRMAEFYNDLATIAKVITLVILFYWISLGFFCAWLAEEKGRNYYVWLGLGIVFGFIALISLVGAPVLEEEEEPPRATPRVH